MTSCADEREATFVAHLDSVAQRTARSLAASGFGSLLIHSGEPPMIFRDDQPYPFKVNAAFKLWAPLTDVTDCFLYFEPGRRPLLLFHKPQDYWHKPADLPDAYWTRAFDLQPIPDRAGARDLLPPDLSRTAYIGDAFPELIQWGVGAINPDPLLMRLDFDRAAKTPYELACLRAASRRGAAGHVAAADAFKSGASEFEIELAFLKACGQREHELPYNPIIALNAGAAVLH